jgi:hypothetical protein
MFSKTRQDERGPVIKLRYTAEEPALRTNFLWRLEQYVAARRAVGCPAGTYLFNPSARSGDKLLDKPLESRALQQRVAALLAQHGMEHCTLHGLRRQLRQDLAADGVEQEEAMKALDIRSKRTDRLYADCERPVRAKFSK